MNNIISEILKAFFVSFVYISLFIFSEVIHKRLKIPVEWTRKSVHFLSALIAVSFPFIFRYTITLFILSISFVIIIVIGERKRLLTSISDVERETFGSIIFPVSIFILYIFGKNNFIAYAISLIVLAVSDPLAALVGISYGHFKYKVQTELKSIEGSVTFFFITFLLVHIPVLVYTNVSRVNSLFISFLVSIIITLLESISFEGSDNIVIPVGTFFILNKLLTKPTEMVFAQIFILIFIILVSIIITKSVKNISSSGVITIIISCYIAWSLGGINYYLSSIFFIIGFLVMNIIFQIRPSNDIKMFKVLDILRIIVIPISFVFFANFFSMEDYFYYPYILSLSIHLTLLWRHCFIDRTVMLKLFRNKRKIFSNFGSIFSYILFILPTLFLIKKNFLYLSITFFISNIFSDAVYSILRYSLYKDISLSENRSIRNFVNIIITALFFIFRAIKILKI
uniref:Phosphatidate cytidylyltransferase n=1 Tax=candidate division WOR-3 bacterium TaxID=2052148 RepID=A0A7C4YSE3_UNCW3